MTANELLQRLFQELENAHGIVCDRTGLDLGNVCKTVYQARNGDERLVVKLGIGRRAAQEIAKNCLGYQELRQIGAEDLLPRRLEYHEAHGVAFFIMSDCGPDFVRATRTANDPDSMYTALVTQMSAVYDNTKHAVLNPLVPIHAARDNVVRQCITHLSAFVDPRRVEQMRVCSFSEITTGQTCFSSFDFTPEDVFLTPHGVKYVDPIPGQLGIPVLDLACFAGVARDAYALPGSTQGYEVLRKFALQEVPALLHVCRVDAERLFVLGRALQCALSARFRLSTDVERAYELARACEQHIAFVVNR